MERIAYHPDGTFYYKYVYKYNDKDDFSEWAQYLTEGSLSSKYDYKYENYDDVGNWLKKIVFHNDIPIEIVERKIEYYK